MTANPEILLSQLTGVRRINGGWSAHCPAHEDRHSSLSVGLGDDGRILVHCHAGCRVEDVLSKLGLCLADLFPYRRTPDSSIVEAYDYLDEKGRLLYQVCRTPQKVFWQRRPDGNGGWISDLKDTPRVPYRLPQVIEAVSSGRTVIVCEGEKDVHTLEHLGFVATTNSGGAGNWQPDFAAYLRNAHVVIIPDNDSAGRKHALAVAAALHGVAAQVRVVELPGVPLKGDVSDWVAMGGTADDLNKLIEDSSDWMPPAAPINNLAAMVANAMYTSTNTDNTITIDTMMVYTTTDLGNAERLVATFGDQLRYEAASNRWHRFDGTRWTPDDTLRVEAFAALTARDIYAEASRESDPHKRQELVNHARSSESRARQQAMVASARHMLAISPSEWDRDPWKLNLLNGTLDLKTGELCPHCKDDLITRLAPVSYDAQAEAPHFFAFLERILPDPEIRDFVQRSAGYALTGVTREQHLWFCYGAGANGKSTLLNMLMAILGDYAAPAPPDLLVRDKSRHPTELAFLRGTRLVVASETREGSFMDETKVKLLTGGDMITARFMGGDFFTFVPSHKLWLMGNHKPRISGTDHAIWRRPLLTDFGVIIPREEQNPELPEKLLEENAGVLRWCVEGCLRWHEQGLRPPSQVLAATERYRLEMDVIGSFLDDNCHIAPDGMVRAADLYEAYCKWCDQNRERALTQRELGARMTERGFQRKRSTRGRIRYLGLTLASQPDDPSDLTSEAL